MINFPRACFSIVAILCRQYVGGLNGGFIALLHALSALLLYTVVMLFLRGFVGGSEGGGLLDVPVLVPMLLFAIGLTAIWCGRTLGMLRYAGPLHLHGPNRHFTGAAGDFLRGRFKAEYEWTLLERHEPAGLCLVGVALLVLPWTRVLGLFLIVLSVVALWQTMRDRSVNEWDTEDFEGVESLGEFEGIAADVASSVGADVGSAYEDLGLAADLLDDGVLDEVRRRTESARATEQVRPDEGEDVGFAEVVETLKPRGPMSVCRRSVPTRVAMVALALLVVNFATGDKPGLYGKAPQRWVAGVESLQSAAVPLGLVAPADMHGPGGLVTAFLQRVDTGELTKRKRAAALTIIEPAQQQVTLAVAATDAVRRGVTDATGLPLAASSYSAELDELFLVRPSVAEAWAALLNGVTRLDTLTTDANGRLQRASYFPEKAPLDDLVALTDEASSWAEQANGLQDHVQHIRVMLGNLRLENALDTSLDEPPQTPPAEGG